MHLRKGSYAANKNILLEMAAMLHMRTFYAGEYDLFFYSFKILNLVD
ncbi:hypothetical protein [Clostridium saccharoperbutylacetonicum]|nr:hypothetical protein [Clostridium saccharoperbutylacetonicum]NSB30483.1 hypothetical protein [Clostridium saccharoperbutylacetonicum]